MEMNQNTKTVQKITFSFLTLIKYRQANSPKILIQTASSDMIRLGKVVTGIQKLGIWVLKWCRSLMQQ